MKRKVGLPEQATLDGYEMKNVNASLRGFVVWLSLRKTLTLMIPQRMSQNLNKKENNDRKYINILEMN